MRRVALAILAVFAIWPTAAMCQQAVEDFYRGKKIDMIIGYSSGGTYDLYSRLVIAHLSRHIPGHPAIVVQYMPGAGGMTGTLYLYGHADADGTQLGMLPRDIAVNQMLHPDAGRYDARRFNWIGRIDSA